MNATDRIAHAVHAGITRRNPQQHIDALNADKDQLLRRGLLIMLGNDYAERDKWLNEYRAICRLIHENENELKSAA